MIMKGVLFQKKFVFHKCINVAKLFCAFSDELYYAIGVEPDMKSLDEMTEATKHARYIELLANEVHQSVETVEPIYAYVYSHLEEAAEIKDYVPVFAWRQARALLRQQ